MDHIREYIKLWWIIDVVRLHEGTNDSIRWILSANGEFSSTSAYNAHFFGATLTRLTREKKMGQLWPLATLQANPRDNGASFLSLSILQEALGYGEELAWYSSYQHHDWAPNLTIKEWWTVMSCKASPNRKALASLTMLASWTILKERNARIFPNKAAPPTILLDFLKADVIMSSFYMSYLFLLFIDLLYFRNKIIT
jgi:hypothetical protein